MTEIDIAAYRYDEIEISTKRPKNRYRVKHDNRFICVPESWAIKAFELAKERQTAGPLITGLVLWQRYHLEHGKQPLKLTNNMLSRFGIGRRSVTRWLGMLEKSGLISLRRFDHRSPLITIICDRNDETVRDH